MTHHQNLPKISLEELRVEIKKEYTNVALDPNKGYPFHTGRKLADILGYDKALYANLPESNIASFAGIIQPQDAIRLGAAASLREKPTCQ